MARPRGSQSQKGSFSDLQLPVAKAYVPTRSRNTMLWLGAGGGLAILAVFLFNITMQRGTLISNGPLSSNHAIFGEDCSTCHTPLGDVTDDKCAVCHEKYGDELGVHSFASHYLYRSGDFTRLVPSPKEVACIACHTEHVGLEAHITAVPDATCLPCHDFGSFDKHHPEFEFAAEGLADEANLKFSHAPHVLRVKERQALADVEQTCLYCHHPEPDGKNFQPISFDGNCDTCHLTSSASTPWLLTGNPAAVGAPGVATLQTIQAQGAPGTRWADYTNPDDFQQRGDRVRKRVLYHEDPWILENLKRLRGVLYPDGGLADLLKTSGRVDPREARVLYEEAMATLREHIEALRNRPEQEVQEELQEAERLVDLIALRLRDPYSPLDETRFALSPADLNPALTAEQVATYRGLIAELTEPCRQCHLLENATLARVQADQDELIRAEFNHRAHIIHKRCLDCHDTIPIRELIAVEAEEPDTTRDHAGLLNVPTIATCQTCHTDDKAADACITCHLFHPDKSQRANLLLYLDSTPLDSPPSDTTSLE